MKRLLVVLIAATLVAPVAAAERGGAVRTDTVLRTCAPMLSYRTMNVSRYRPACIQSLRHEIPGVVECALRDAMLLKIARPELDLPEIKKEIDDLAMGGMSTVIRYKAGLAKQVYENPEMFLPLASTEYITADEAFAAVARRLEQTMLVLGN
jgi:hypothetical protein